MICPAVLNPRILRLEADETWALKWGWERWGWFWSHRIRVAGMRGSSESRSQIPLSKWKISCETEGGRRWWEGVGNPQRREHFNYLYAQVYHRRRFSQKPRRSLYYVDTSAVHGAANFERAFGYRVCRSSNFPRLRSLAISSEELLGLNIFSFNDSLRFWSASDLIFIFIYVVY